MKLPVKLIRELNISPSADDGMPHLSAGSGIACIQNWIYVAADDELSVGVFPRYSKEAGTLRPLFDGVLSGDYKKRKKQKPDLESILFLPSEEPSLVIVPSGSRDNRVNGALVITSDSGEIVQTHPVNFEELYGVLEQHVKDLNIEGATVFGDSLVMFQRGNKGNSENAIVSLDLKKFVKSLHADRTIKSDCIGAVNHCVLEKIQGVPLSFTDACSLDDEHIVFTATAENTPNPYDDGEDLGSIIGILDCNFKVVATHTIDFPEKVEGVWIVNKSPLKTWDGEVLLVTDADDRRKPSKLLSARVTV